MPTPVRASEELLAAPLDQMILNLGLAVAQANAALGKARTEDGAERIVFAIPEADIELSVAISVTQSSELKAEGKFGLQAVALSAAYTSTYAFSEQASSKIKLKLRAVPVAETEA